MIYADINGSAPLHPEVQHYLQERLPSGPYGNPNAIHHLGQKLQQGIEQCRSICAQALGARPEQVIFTSGATESIAQVFHSVLGEGSPPGVIISSEIEHAAVYENVRYYQSRGYEVQWVKVDRQGRFDLEHLEQLLKLPSVALVALMAANNEVGTLEPYQAIAQLSGSVPYLCDTSQLIGKGVFSLQDSGVDFACLSGHKLGALTGTGILLCQDPSSLSPLLRGGGQERGLRAGTQHYLGIETLALVLDLLDEKLAQLSSISQAQLEFERKLTENFQGVCIVGEEAPRLPGTTLVGHRGLHGQAVQIELESRKIFVTTSSACSDNDPEMSRVLQALEWDEPLGRSVIRISMGDPQNIAEQYHTLYGALSDAYHKLGKIQIS